ncbi:dTDP-4-amino-4,6-dideoxygalactose transaminase [Algoriphagus sp. A40]|uniref:dTDP-4-amino-4,6-dideoxygalactose transaminase n=1 Tax=Algoriphagus sp. A40 TaxID=1945863 RepID=UPI000986E4A3|nr:dTDP-4-amino-4,6-dideoxygalactose transaminase [Algoriphagus sp. A40]OOG69896.1 dTDP-4-amino-4,6-dideoxygalactose transaminase [Algoriphagus sp. A40]
MQIPFNKPFLTGQELSYIQQAVNLGKISGNGEFTRRCQEFFEQRYGFHKCLLTTSCTDALEMAAILLDIKPGDEVILPSFTFVSSANAFVLRGAKIVFVDSKPDHPNLDETLIEALITPKTKAIVVVHYGGVHCEMDTIMDIANRHGIRVVEDAAQAIDSFYKGKALGGIGHLGCFSFHETKNIQCGEGGMLVLNDPSFVKRAEIIWEKGTDRAAFFRGEIDKYGWVDLGSSFLPSEVTAAFLWAQLENLDRIQERRKAIWEDYYGFLEGKEYKPKVLGKEYLIAIRNEELIIKNYRPIPNSSFLIHHSKFIIPHSPFQSNAHLFYLLFQDLETRTAYATDLKQKGILSVFHYQSLHRSMMAKTHFPNQYAKKLPHSDYFSDRLLRLPLFYELPEMSGTLFIS